MRQVGPAANAAPAELRRRVADREADLAGGGLERVFLVEREIPAALQVVEADDDEHDRRRP